MNARCTRREFVALLLATWYAITAWPVAARLHPRPRALAFPLVFPCVLRAEPLVHRVYFPWLPAGERR